MVDKLATALKDKFKLGPSHLTILTEKPRAGESVANIENVKSALGKFAQEITKDDTLFVMLIGHGSGSGGDAKFNLVGPDLTATEWNALLQPISARIAFVDDRASAGFRRDWPGERVIITATTRPPGLPPDVWRGVHRRTHFKCGGPRQERADLHVGSVRLRVQDRRAALSTRRHAGDRACGAG
jgi:hypothetical protein